MADISIEVDIKSWTPQNVYALIAASNYQAAEHFIREAQTNLDQDGSNDTGLLRKSFHIDNSRYGLLGAEATVTNDAPYASFVNDGTADRIYPNTASVLKFKPGKKGSYLGGRGVYNSRPTGKFSSQYLFRPYVKGQRATHFMDDAMTQLTVYDWVTNFTF